MIKAQINSIPSRVNQLGAVVALSASSLSLLASTVFNLVPCTLCYWQRIFMYPLVFIYLGAMWRRDAKTYIYSLPLAIVGAGFAAYHYSLQMGWLALAEACISGVSCTDTYVEFAGFFTIPFGSLLGFLSVVGLSLMQWHYQMNSEAVLQQSFTKQLQPVIVAVLGIVLIATAVLQTAV